MITVEHARQRIMSCLSPGPVEYVSLETAHGRVLAETVQARRDQPPWDCSAMDGYAVRCAEIVDTPRQMPVSHWIPAGCGENIVLPPGHVARIFTGAPLPDGADSIVMQENVDAPGDGHPGENVTFRDPAILGRHVRSKGLDFAIDEFGPLAGIRLGVRELAVAAAMNHPWLPVYRRPRVAILSSGDEIVRTGEPIRAGQIVSSNADALAAFVRYRGGEPSQLAIIRDRMEDYSRLASMVSKYDLVITTGGASVGAYDMLAPSLTARGSDPIFWRVALRPGKPLLFGFWDDTPLLGLPGNPVSAIVCAYLFLSPALARLTGLRLGEKLSLQPALLGQALAANDDREDFLRARLRPADSSQPGLPSVEPFDRQDSSMLRVLMAADCLIRRPINDRAREVGEIVETLSLHEFSH